MSKILLLLLFTILVLSFVQCGNDKPFEPINNSVTQQSLQKEALPNSIYVKVFRAAGPITIDGLEDEWDDVPKHKMREYYDLDAGPVDGKFDLSAYFKMVWDDENLYIFVHILNDSISVNAIQDWDKDSFELFIDSDNSKNPPPDDNIPHAYPGSYDANDEQWRFVWQQPVQRLPWFYDTSMLEYAYHQTGNGWSVELMIPFDALVDFPAQAGHVFGIEFHINDNDGDGRENFLKWWSQSDYTYLYPSLFGSAYLFDSVAE